MYRITEWRNGWLYIQSNPRSDFYRATESQMIEHLLEENQRLKDMIAAIRGMVETVSQTDGESGWQSGKSNT